MAQEIRHSFSGNKRKQSAGFRQGNMAVFMYGNTKRKRRKKVKGK